MTKTFELKVDKLLLDSKFDGYKLSLEKLPMYERNISGNAPVHNSPSEDQYSLQHAKLYSDHNHLISDPWCSESATYISGDGGIWYTCWMEETHDLDAPQCVWSIPSLSTRIKGYFNPCLRYCSERIAIVTDGGGLIYVLETGNRKERITWTVSLSIEAVPSPCVLIDSILYNEGMKLVCALITVEEVEKDRGDNSMSSHFNSHLHYINFNKGSDWSIGERFSITSTSAYDYVSIGENSEALYVVTEGKLNTGHQPTTTVADNNMEHKDATPAVYSWLQTSDSVTIYIPLSDNIDYNKQDITINTTIQHIEVKVKNEIVLNGDLFLEVKVNETAWYLEKEQKRLTIELFKMTSGGVQWEEAVLNVKGELDSEYVQQVHERLAHLTSDEQNPPPTSTGDETSFNVDELEACDVMTSQEMAFYRIQTQTKYITHKSCLSNHRILLQSRPDPSLPSSLCLRYDVDGLLFTPPTGITLMEEENNEQKFECLHTATFHALGYVHASKQHRFTLCAQDLSYAAICEVQKHVYIYRQPSPIDTELRNRHSGRQISHIAKQQLISLEPPEEILGCITCQSGALYLLTHTRLLRVVVN